MSDKKDETFLARWLNDELTEEERRKFESSEEFLQYQKIIAATDNIIGEDFDMDSMLSKVKAGKNPQIHRSATNKVLKLWGYGIAATVALVIGFFFIYDQDTVLSTDFGEQQTALLPDGSEIVLNSRSMAVYNEKNWANDRRIELEGEAYFKVKSGSQFTVTSDGGDVTVLGTEFNVQFLAGLFQVTCYEGKVKVVTDKSEHLLIPGNSFRSIQGEEVLLTSDDIQPGWTVNESNFKSVPIRYVLLALENQFNIKFRYNKLDHNVRFTGSFPHSDQEAALKIVLGSLQLNYEQKDNRTIILKD